ncbi:unnamed protein product [Natator depressus]
MAHPLLEISLDGKEVKCGSFRKNVSSSLSQFDTANCVVARQSFSAGRHYWEVFVGQKTRWNLRPSGETGQIDPEEIPVVDLG